jgi:hypothetical protein
MNSQRNGLVVLVCLLFGGAIASGAPIAAVDVPVVLDFTGYRGTGYEPGPTVEKLDSNTFLVEGLVSDVDESAVVLSYGDSVLNIPSLANGKSAGASIARGIYAADLGGTDRGLGMQPTANTLTPGAITARFQNNTGVTLGSFDISYEIWVFNDKTEISGLNFAWSTGNPAGFTGVPALDYITPKTAAGSPAYALAVTRTTSVTATVAPGDYFYAQFQSYDPAASTGGSRDELALDDISITGHAAAITAVPEPTSAVLLMALAMAPLARRRRN